MDATEIRFIGAVVRLCGAENELEESDMNRLSDSVIEELSQIYEVD